MRPAAGHTRLFGILDMFLKVEGIRKSTIANFILAKYTGFCRILFFLVNPGMAELCFLFCTNQLKKLLRVYPPSQRKGTPDL